MNSNNNPYAARAPEPAANPYAAPRSVLADGDAGAVVLASRGQRLFAAIIDYVVFLVPFAASGVAFAVTRRASLPVGVGVATLVAIIVGNALLLARNGQTLGKLFAGIRIVRADGSRASFSRLFWLRTVLVSVVTAVFGLFWLVDVLFIFRDDRRCLHDLMADTQVVEASRARSP